MTPTRLKIDPQSRAPTRPAMARRSGQHPRRPRRDPDCHPVEAAERALPCANIAQNMMGTIRRVTRNVKRWRDAGIALRWVAANMIEVKQELPTIEGA